MAITEVWRSSGDIYVKNIPWRARCLFDKQCSGHHATKKEIPWWLMAAYTKHKSDTN